MHNTFSWDLRVVIDQFSIYIKYHTAFIEWCYSHVRTKYYRRCQWFIIVNTGLKCLFFLVRYRGLFTQNVKELDEDVNLNQTNVENVINISSANSM